MKTATGSPTHNVSALFSSPSTPQFSPVSYVSRTPALLNLVETFFNLAYVYRAYVSQSPAAPLLGFSAAVMTLSKTVLYWAQEYYCGGCSIGHNTWKDLIAYWIIPNG